ncbi:MAG: peptidylprolyl isomerase [Bacteroides sp.]|nr:peptidylprolyl isomerase [Bacteroides sp.]MBD5271171.1 peptidylprolyl isomerase [Bacteroides sp.]MBD5332731.1 peptidylprolyl isomerase [Bacteroides sp.]
MASLIGAAAAMAAIDNSAEEVAWVVGDQPIWKSEIEEAYQQMLSNNIAINGDPYCVIPEQLAIQKLYLHQADVDTVEVQASMVNQEVEQYINAYVSDLGSVEKLEQMFGKPISRIRQSLRESRTNSSRINMVQDKIVGDIKATPSDVRKYFDALPADSIPYVPRKVEVEILTAAPAIPREEIENVKARLRDYADRVTRGESEFSTLAILYSDDPVSAARGGELGFQGRATYVPEFSAVAFNLNDPKKVSKVVETEFGYHIIQLIEKRGDRANFRHILLRPRVAEKDLEEAVIRLDSLRADITQNDIPFEEAVIALSMDKDTRNNRGLMVVRDRSSENYGTSRFEMAELPQEVARQVNNMEPGQISQAFIMKDPKTNQEIVALVKLVARHEGHRATFADDYQLIKTMAENDQKQKKLEKWVESKIAETYVRIEDGWRNCDFVHKGWIKGNKNSK